MSDSQRKLAVVTGASTGIGLELARECAKNDFDLIIASQPYRARAATDHTAAPLSPAKIHTQQHVGPVL